MAANLAEKIDVSGLQCDLMLDLSGNIDLLTVKFDGYPLEPGYKFSKDQVKNEPKIEYIDASSDSLHTLLMIDPDAPSRENPVKRSWLHWMIVNIPGQDIKAGEVKCSFNPSTPPPKSGFHRYVFLMFKQDQKLTNIAKYSNRGSFDAADFVAGASLGKAVAANFYEARHEAL